MRNLNLSSRSFPIYLVLDDWGTTVLRTSRILGVSEYFQRSACGQGQTSNQYATYSARCHVASHSLCHTDTRHTQTYPTPYTTAELVHAHVQNSVLYPRLTIPCTCDGGCASRMDRISATSITIYVTMSKATTAEGKVRFTMSYRST